ncbi:MAG: amidohydrolase family protein, partial [Acidimicrobiia bacterium]
AMEGVTEHYPIVAWKVYTHAGGPGWWLDDADPARPQVCNRFVEQAVALGRPTIAVHKGFGNGSPHASPADVGPAARAHSDARFVVYHSGFEASVEEGPYTAATRHVGVNRLVRTVLESGVGPGANVYAELGSTWRAVMGDPDAAAHVVGKLLRFLGEDNVVWGTDSIWYGSPQDQIQAFRSFEISEEFQEQYGYPALTAKTKEKILGLNSAKIYKVKPTRDDCEFTREELEQVRQALPTGMRTFGPTTVKDTAALIRAHGIA